MLSHLRDTTSERKSLVTAFVRPGARMYQPDSNPQTNTRRKRTRDLSKAVTLRPAEVFELFGIPPSTLCELCKHPDEAKRMPSRLVPGRKGHKGLRLLVRAEVEAYLNRHRA